MSNYGTSARTAASRQGSGRLHVPASDQQPLLGEIQGESRQPPFTRFNEYMTADVSKQYGDLVLLTCYIITGLLDSSATAIWGAFVSMQTGNTVYVGLGLANPTGSSRWIKSLTSIAFFCIGSFFFSRFHRYFSPRRRWVLVVSFIVQLLMIVASAILVVLTPPVKADVNEAAALPPWHVLVSLALVGFQSSGQAVTSRALEYGGLTSVVLTSIYCDLFSDARLFAGLTQNVERNRRAAAPVLLLVGAVIGGLWSQSSYGIAGAMWTAAGLKILIIVAWLLWKKDKTGESE